MTTSKKIILSSFIIIAIFTSTDSFARTKREKKNKYRFYNPSFQNFYIRASGGFSFPLAISDTGNAYQSDLKKHNVPKVYSLALGYDFNEDWRADISIRTRDKYVFSGFKSSFYDSGLGSNNKMTNIYTSHRLRNTSFMLNAHYNIKKFSQFTPYLTAGIGASLNKSGNYVTDYTWGNIKVHNETIGKRSVSFAFDFGAGSLFNIGENTYFDLSYKNATLGKFKTKNIDTDGRAANIVKTKFRLHEVSMALIFKLR